MRTLGLIYLFALSMGAPAMAAQSAPRAGVVSGGGATSMVCRDLDGKIQRAELLDLYEAKEKFHLKLMDSVGSLEGDYVQAVKNTYRLQGAEDLFPIDAEVRKNLDRFLRKLEFSSIRLPFLGDVGESPALPQGCGLEQLAIFYDIGSTNDGSVTDTDRIEVSQEIWDALSSQSQAALVTHELTYKWERSLAEKTSESTRSFVAHIYSSDAIPVRAGLPSGTRQYVTLEWLRFEDGSFGSVPSKNSYFWVFPSLVGKDHGVTLQFEGLMGRPIASKATIGIPGIRWSLRPAYDRDSQSITCLVDEPSQDIDIKMPLSGSQHPDWAVEVRYQTGHKVKLGLYQKGVLLEEAFVDFCD
jgi:hypothetical protein